MDGNLNTSAKCSYVKLRNACHILELPHRQNGNQSCCCENNIQATKWKNAYKISAVADSLSLPGDAGPTRMALM